MENAGGSAESTADLIVKRKQLSPVFLKRLQSISENMGGRLVAEVEVGGTPSPKVTWFKDGIPIADQPGHIKIHDDGPCHTLIIAKTDVSKISTWYNYEMFIYVIFTISLAVSPWSFFQ